MSTNLQQAGLFEQSSQLPHGLLYHPEFITRDEEAALLEAVAPLPLREAQFREYFAKRRVAHFHTDVDAPLSQESEHSWRYPPSRQAGASLPSRDDADSFSSGPLPPFLIELRRKVALWIGIEPAAFVHALVSEYRPGTPIGWHRDKPIYGVVAGVSLAGFGRMRWRPYDRRFHPKDIVTLDLAPRSAYLMRDAIRSEWQHSMLPTKMLRYSITLRTRATGHTQ